jgi:chromosome segregation protein
MRLSKIKLSGFKSFVDATTVTFPSNLMGIVGPNGCGKSNIIDAIRWVLGESSAKTLRGDSMADVIFNGSSGRKPVSQASIELVFDNSDGTLTGAYAQYSEISVRRILARDGTSNYFLNGARCRRKDITHILLGTGVGSNGYSIIEQGMISRVVEAKPDELRGFLEEAAGISKYKERRRETEHRIRHTRENLERLGDLREEIEKQLAHLKRQASAATRYKELKSEQRKVHAELLALRLKALRAELAEQEGALAEKQQAFEAALAAQRTLEMDTEQLRAELGERHETLNGVQGEYYRVGAEIARLEQSIQHRKDLIKRQREDLETTEQQLEEIRAHIANDQLELEQLDHALEALSPELDQAVSDRQASEELLAEAESAMERARERWEQLARDLSNSEGAARVEEARLEQLGAQRDRVLRETDKQSAERAALDMDAPGLRLEQLVADEETLKGSCADAARALDGVWHQIQELREQDQNVSTRLHQLREELQNDRGRLASLEALQEAAIGQTTQQVGRWLEHAPLADRRSLGQRLVVDAGWDRAVETVLGSYLQAVTVDALDAVTDTLGELTEGGLALIEELDAATDSESADAGRSANADAERSASADAERSAGSETRDSFTGVESPVGWLADHVRGPAAARPLLTGVRTAESLRAAIVLRDRLGPSQSVVTREGFWIGRTWLRINRSDDPEVGVIARAEEISRLQAKIQVTSAAGEEAARALTETRARLEQLEEDRKSAQIESTRRQQLHTDARAKLEAARTELEQIRNRAAALDRSLDELRAEQRVVDDKLEQSRHNQEEASLRLEELREQRAQLEEERDRHQSVLAEARARAEHDRQAAHELALKVESRRHSKESASAALARVEGQQQHLLKRRDELRTRLEGATDPLAEDESKLASLAEARASVESRLAEARTAAEQTEDQLRELEQRRSHAQQAVSEAREGADSVRLGVREAQVRSETVAEQFRETGFDLEQIIGDLEEGANAEAWHETLDRLERRIQRLGPINLAAIDEFQQQSERKTYLDAQYADLTEALETLENAIRKIDKETRSRFKDTFDRANQGFQRLFPRLFGGGHAYLELDGEDLLESGVAVMARPPGKRNSTIHLLSGGEKALTAVALVFSIFELNPAPFCLLDEVDAPLDEANVGRFSDIVREMSEQVQFVIITHNKTTMESMHQLAGVTMNEPGVSRLVAVDLDEAVKLAAM